MGPAELTPISVKKITAESAWDAPPSFIQYAVHLIYKENMLLVHIQLGIHGHSQVLFSETAIQPVTLQLVQIHEAMPAHGELCTSPCQSSEGFC